MEITIPIELYDQLIDDSYMIEAMYVCGVENWGGFDDALTYYEGLKERNGSQEV